MEIGKIMHRDVQIIGPQRESAERGGNDEEIGCGSVAGR
jgi:hypothetical protein